MELTSAASISSEFLCLFISSDVYTELRAWIHIAWQYTVKGQKSIRLKAGECDAEEGDHAGVTMTTYPPQISWSMKWQAAFWGEEKQTWTHCVCVCVCVQHCSVGCEQDPGTSDPDTFYCDESLFWHLATGDFQWECQAVRRWFDGKGSLPRPAAIRVQIYCASQKSTSLQDKRENQIISRGFQEVAILNTVK